jgi:hypothetical protein
MGIEGIENLQEEGAAPGTAGSDPSTWDKCAEVPTTSPDVVITEDPGPAPEGDPPADDDTHTDTDPADPPSDETPVDVLDA